jgi:hypothetical protein
MAGYDVEVTPGGLTVLSGEYQLGMPIQFAGTFPIDPVVAYEEGGFVALLQESLDNSTWTNVAQTITNTGGYYSMSYTPQTTGSYYYRVHMPGVSANTAAVSGATGPTFPYEGITAIIDPQTSPVTNVTVTSLESELTPLTNQVNSFGGAISNATYMGYIGIALGAIALIAAVVLGMRKK